MMTRVVERAKGALRSRFGVLVLLSAIFLVLQTAVRLALLVGSGSLRTMPLRVPWIVGVGVISDLYPVAMAAGGGALLLALIPSRLWRTRLFRGVVSIFCIVVITLAMVVAVAEWLFWAEFETRFNFIAVEYLIYRDEVARNILESYSVGRMVSVLAVATLLLFWLLRRQLRRALDGDSPFRVRALVAAGCVAVAALAVALPEPETGGDARTIELIRNGPYQFVSAFRVNEIDYEQFYITRPPGDVMRATRARLLPPSTDPVGVLRQVDATRPERRLNVVMLVMESMSASYLGAYGSPWKLTPNMDALATQSLWFSNVYATGTRTVRGLEALSLSMPPTPGHSIVKRPGSDGLRTLGAPFQARGYDTIFMSGAYGYFDNMNGFFGSAGFRILDRTSFARNEAVFTNAWGVSDEDIFGKLLREADATWQAKRPFMYFALTASNHRPFTFPQGRITMPQGTRESAVKYTDWAIGHFLQQARTRPWFDDTIFVIVADHCARSGGRTELPIENFKIPLFVYAPKYIEPRRVDKLVSQIDVAPTLLALLGFSYSSTFYGQDMLGPGEERAFLGTYQALGFLHHQQLTMLEPKRRVTAYAVKGTQSIEKPVDQDELDLTVDYYQSAAQAFRSGALKLSSGSVD
jgi:phosphoglycerol transferase MdoB-like AlkP superfamily enzyme